MLTEEDMESEFYLPFFTLTLSFSLFTSFIDAIIVWPQEKSFGSIVYEHNSCVAQTIAHVTSETVQTLWWNGADTRKFHFSIMAILKQ